METTRPLRQTAGGRAIPHEFAAGQWVQFTGTDGVPRVGKIDGIGESELLVNVPDDRLHVVPWEDAEPTKAPPPVPKAEAPPVREGRTRGAGPDPDAVRARRAAVGRSGTVGDADGGAAV